MLSALLTLTVLAEVGNLSYVSPTGRTGIAMMPHFIPRPAGRGFDNWHANETRQVDLASGHASPLVTSANATTHFRRFFAAAANEDDQYLFCMGLESGGYACSLGTDPAGPLQPMLLKSPRLFFGPDGKACYHGQVDCEDTFDCPTHVVCDGQTLFKFNTTKTYRVIYRPDTHDFVHKFSYEQDDGFVNSIDILTQDGTIKYSGNISMDLSMNGKYGLSTTAVYTLDNDSIIKVKDIQMASFNGVDYRDTPRSISNDGAFLYLTNANSNRSEMSVGTTYQISLEYPDDSVHLLSCNETDCPSDWYVAESTFGLTYKQYDDVDYEGTLTKIYKKKKGGSGGSGGSGDSSDEAAYIAVGVICGIFAAMWLVAMGIKTYRSRQGTQQNDAYRPMSAVQV